jgi:hypothetical protein
MVDVTDDVIEVVLDGRGQTAFEVTYLLLDGQRDAGYDGVTSLVLAAVTLNVRGKVEGLVGKEGNGCFATIGVIVRKRDGCCSKSVGSWSVGIWPQSTAREGRERHRSD